LIRYGNKEIKTFIFSSKPLILVLLYLFINIPLFAETKFNIDYYGIVAQDIDDNMSKMTSDLYYTQLCEINSYSVNDKRQDTKMPAIPDSQLFDEDKLSFYAVISKKDNSSKWISTLCIYDSSKKSTYTQAKEYDSFYKILMEPKSSLQETISSLLSGGSQASSVSDTGFDSNKAGLTLQSTEFLSGTWGGEDSIEKIVIMRGGRGFVIFKNGASMNITIKLEESASSQSIIITQSGKSNASFFPELSRELALKEAINAAPIQWVLQAQDDNTLSGTKTTLIQTGQSADTGTISVTWKRK